VHVSENMILKTAAEVRDYFTADIVNEFIDFQKRFSNKDKKLLDAEKRLTPRGARLKAALTPVVSSFLENEHYRGRSLVNTGGYDPSREGERYYPFSKNLAMQKWFEPISRQREMYYKEKPFVSLQTRIMEVYDAFKEGDVTYTDHAK